MSRIIVLCPALAKSEYGAVLTPTIYFKIDETNTVFIACNYARTKMRDLATAAKALGTCEAIWTVGGYRRILVEKDVTKFEFKIGSGEISTHTTELPTADCLSAFATAAQMCDDWLERRVNAVATHVRSHAFKPYTTTSNAFSFTAPKLPTGYSSAKLMYNHFADETVVCTLIDMMKIHDIWSSTVFATLTAYAVDGPAFESQLAYYKAYAAQKV